MLEGILVITGIISSAVCIFALLIGMVLDLRNPKLTTTPGTRVCLWVGGIGCGMFLLSFFCLILLHALIGFNFITLYRSLT